MFTTVADAEMVAEGEDTGRSCSAIMFSSPHEQLRVRQCYIEGPLSFTSLYSSGKVEL